MNPGGVMLVMCRRNPRARRARGPLRRSPPPPRRRPGAHRTSPGCHQKVRRPIRSPRQAGGHRRNAAGEAEALASPGFVPDRRAPSRGTVTVAPPADVPARPRPCDSPSPRVAIWRTRRRTRPETPTKRPCLDLRRGCPLPAQYVARRGAGARALRNPRISSAAGRTVLEQNREAPTVRVPHASTLGRDC